MWHNLKKMSQLFYESLKIRAKYAFVTLQTETAIYGHFGKTIHLTTSIKSETQNQKATLKPDSAGLV